VLQSQQNNNSRSVGTQVKKSCQVKQKPLTLIISVTIFVLLMISAAVVTNSHGLSAVDLEITPALPLVINQQISDGSFGKAAVPDRLIAAP
jgi:hypothetical protein